MSLNEQALFLLDIQPSIQRRNNPESFSCLDQTVVDSFPGCQAAAPAPGPEPAQETLPYSVATRMSRANYEDQAKAEALMNALRQIRASHAARKAQHSRRQS